MAEGVEERRNRRVVVVSDAEQLGEFGFEMVERLEAGRRGIEVIKRALEQVVQRGVRVLRLDRGFKQLAAVTGQEDGAVVAAQALAPVVDGYLAQRMKVSVTGSIKRNFPAEEEVDFSCERAFRPPGSAGYGFHKAMDFSKPMDDQAGFGEPGETDRDGFRGMHKQLPGGFPGHVKPVGKMLQTSNPGGSASSKKP